VVRGFGVKVLSIYPYGPDAEDSRVSDVNFERRLSFDDVEIVVHSTTDGRQRICAALTNVEPYEIVNEGFLDQQLFGAAGNPDLVIVLGPANCLPASLVWELAYGEIVFVDQGWTGLSIESINHAIQEYSSRHRRFGGVDT
jgi:undecaprenyl diphosphate synthase